MATSVRISDVRYLVFSQILTRLPLFLSRTQVNLDKSKFIRQSIREKAASVIAAHEKTQFTLEDWQAFFTLFDNSPEPTERMKKAVQTYKAIVADEI